MRILIKTSKWATWARRLGSVAVPLVIISVAFHRLGVITSEQFLAAAGSAALVALTSAVAALIALAQLWQSGDRGWGRALSGLLLGLVCLAPFAWFGVQALRYPAVTDIATTNRGQLPLIFDPGTIAMPPPKLLAPEAIGTTFPNLATRTYPLGQFQTYALVHGLIEDNGWHIVRERPPTETWTPALINARTQTVVGWREEVAVSVAGDADRSIVDMRSVSLNALHDFGSNGLRIERFLIALDGAVTELLRDNPNANQPLDDEPEPADATEN